MAVLLIMVLVVTGMTCILALVLGRLVGGGEALLNLARDGSERKKIAKALKECTRVLLEVEERDLAEDLRSMNIYGLKALKAAISAVFVDVLERRSNLVPRVAVSSQGNTLHSNASTVAAGLLAAPAAAVDTATPSAVKTEEDAPNGLKAQSEEMEDSVQLITDPEQPEPIVATNL
ncbi:unnamed protein product [Durusdinium trenchii]|uniref:Uncharacterized protein n=2 Tax=Durusdinium trenchii TaxID=1381693 RepID=A0ABP0IID4_9DINO